jgi:hypothetical protein
MDYLEKEAIAAGDTAKTNCLSQSGSAYSDCVLKVLPFTSINLTEIADWTSSNTNQVHVDNSNYGTSITKPDPVRGGVTVDVNNATNGSTASAYSLDRKSNTGLLDLSTNAISTADNAQWSTSPSQLFQISTGAAAAGANTFYVALTGSGIVNPTSGLGPGWQVGASPSTGCSAYSPSAGNYLCAVNVANALPGAIGVDVTGYNKQSLPGAAVAIPNNTACVRGASEPNTIPATRTYTTGTTYNNGTNLTYTPRTCSVYPTPTAVNTTTGASPTSTTVTNGSGQSARTLFNFANVTGDPVTADTNYVDLVTITFLAPAVSNAPTCYYTCNQYNNTNTDCKSNAKTNIFSGICTP